MFVSTYDFFVCVYVLLCINIKVFHVGITFMT